MINRRFKSSIFLVILLFAISIVSSLPITVIPLDGSGNVQPSTSFEYQWNFSTTSTCDSIVYSVSENITTDKYGRGFIDISLDNMTAVPTHLCEYKDGVLRKAFVLEDQVFKNIFINNLNMSGHLNLGGNSIFNVNTINITNNTYVHNLISYNGNSINVQPGADEDDFFSFKTLLDRPTIKREGGKFIYFESSNVNDVGISFRKDATYSGTLAYAKDDNIFKMLGKESPIAIVPNSEYLNYILFETYNNQPQISVFNGTTLKIDDNLEIIGDLNITGIVSETNISKAYAQTDYHNETDPLEISLTVQNQYENITGLHLDYNNSIHMNGQATIGKAGMYHLTGSISFSGGNSGLYRYNLFVNNEEEHACGSMRTTSSSQLGSLSINCIVPLIEGDTVNMRVKDTTTPVQNVKIYTLTFNMVEI